MSTNEQYLTAETNQTVEVTDTTAPEVVVEDSKDWKAEAEKYKADAEKWKAMSRKNEDSYKNASSELDVFKQSNLTESEKALADAKAEGRNAALAELMHERAQDKLEVAAATAGVDVSDLVEDLNMNRFISDNNVDADAINSFVQKIAEKPGRKAVDKGKPASQLGVGPQGVVPAQLTQSDLSKMSPKQIVEAEKAGRLENLKSGKGK